jgi:hypothetical protein
MAAPDYELTLAEQLSGMDRLKWAEGLISQLPTNHEGRNSWLLNFGRGDEAKARRASHGLRFLERTQSAETSGEKA